MTRRGSYSVLIWALLALSVWAHGGQYTNPNNPGTGTPRKGPTGDPRGGGTTAGAEPTWRNWWDRNREAHFNVLERRRAKLDQAAAGQGYDRPELHQPATKEDIRDIIVPLLVKAVKDANADVRDAAAIALGRAGSVPELEHLTPLLDDGNKSVREAAMLGIGLLRHAMAEDVLVKRLADPELGAKERGIAAIALGLSGGKRAQEQLSRDLGTESPFPRIARAKYRQVEGCRALGLGLIGKPEGLGAITSGVRKDRTRDQLFAPMAVAALSHLPDPTAAEIAASELGNNRAENRRSAAILAGHVYAADDKKSAAELLRIVDAERDEHTTNFLLISLGRIGGETATAGLRKIFDKARHRETRAFAALALGLARDSESVPALRKAVAKGADETMRGAAAVALGILRDAESAPMILEVLKNERNPELRADLVTALGMLEAKEALEVVREVLGEARNRRLVQAAGLYLAVMDDSTSVDLMLSILRNSSSLQVKGGMATAIGRMADRRAIEPLVKMIGDRSQTDQTRAFAIVALGLIGDKSPISDFARVAIDSNYSLSSAEALIEVIDIF